MKEYAAGLADALRSEPDVQVQMVEGARGELTVLVDGRTVASKGDSMPEVAEVLDAVRETASVADAS